MISLHKMHLAYLVDTNASDYQLGAALFQTDEDGQRPNRIMVELLESA